MGCEAKEVSNLLGRHHVGIRPQCNEEQPIRISSFERKNVEFDLF